MMKLGILGGTFNPIHIGHLIAAQEVQDSLMLDKVIFMPTGNPPHKEEREVVSAEHRLQMVKLAVDKNPVFEASDLEVNRGGKTYTYDTLMDLKKTYKDCEIYFIVGFDTLKDMDSWKNINDVFKMCIFVVVNREAPTSEVTDEINHKRLKYSSDIRMVTIPDIRVSSTEIRERIKEGRSIRYLMPQDVVDYIRYKGLYN